MSMLCCMLALTPKQMRTLKARPGLTVALSNTQYQEGGVEIEKALEVDDADDEEEESEGEDDDYEENYDLTDNFEEEDKDIDLSTVFDEPVRKTLQLVKSWDTLRFLLEKFKPEGEWANSLMAGYSIGGDLGYGEASLRPAEETEDFARFLKSVSLDQLLSRVNYRELLAEQLYAFPYGPEPDAVYETLLRKDVTYFYPQLRDYVAKAAAAKHGLLIWLE